jgi:hypothetical protein
VTEELQQQTDSAEAIQHLLRKKVTIPGQKPWEEERSVRILLLRSLHEELRGQEKIPLAGR